MPLSDYPDQSLGDLLEHKTEELAIEYKEWMDLSDSVNRAKLAKHICAISNYGGGWLIFGMDDDGNLMEDIPPDIEKYDQDTINGIALKYLVPPPHCRVLRVLSRQNGLHYPIVQIPSHGSVPVCAGANGPEAKGKNIGVTRGTYYIRVQGPRSVPIDSPELWRDLIHRCVVNERDALLGSIGRLFDRPATASETDVMAAWLDQAFNQWSEAQLPQHMRQWRVDPVAHRASLSFRFLTSQGVHPAPLTMSGLKRAIEEAQSAAYAQYPYGLAPFVQPVQSQQRSKIVVLNDVDGYETQMVHDGINYEREPTFWQITSDGKGIEIRCYIEDSEWLEEAVTERSTREWSSGSRLSPLIQARRLYQFIVFIAEFSKSFDGVVRIEATCDYSGLRSRILDNPSPLHSSYSRASNVDHRRSNISASPEALVGEGAFEAAANLLDPILRLFEGGSATPELIKAAIKR